MNEKINSHPWSVDALIAKARLSSERMHSSEASGSDHALWSAITLELLARAALASISPALLADERNWRNLSFAMGISPTAKKFTPISIGIKEVIARLAELDSQTTQEIQNFCAIHFDKRNGELHSGELSFADYRSSSWLPKFYQASQVFLEKASLKIEDFFPDPKHVAALIASLNDKAAESVREDIEAYKKVWAGKAVTERELLAKQAEIWANRQTGHRVKCPACGCRSLLNGTATGPVQTLFDDDEIRQKQTYIPSSFECIACGLKIAGFSKLAACHLGDAFTATTSTEPSEFFGLYTEADIETAVSEAEYKLKRDMYEPDNND